MALCHESQQEARRVVNRGLLPLMVPYPRRGQFHRFFREFKAELDEVRKQSSSILDLIAAKEKESRFPRTSRVFVVYPPHFVNPRFLFDSNSAIHS